MLGGERYRHADAPGHSEHFGQPWMLQNPHRKDNQRTWKRTIKADEKIKLDNPRMMLILAKPVR